jgi:hypothetical protein
MGHPSLFHRFFSFEHLLVNASLSLSMQIPESAHLWALFIGGHGLHVMNRASLSAGSSLSGTKTRVEWLRTNALALVIRLFVNAAAFSYWLAHPAAATHAINAVGVPANFTLEPGHATAAMFGLSGDSLVDWAAAKVPFLQKEIPTIDHDAASS